MNRRDALKLLGGLPLLGFLALPEVEPADEFERLQAELVEVIKDSNLENVIPSPSALAPRYAKIEINESGASWGDMIADTRPDTIVSSAWVEPVPYGEAVQYAPRIEVQEDGSIHITGGEWARWNGKTWEPLPPE